MALHDDEGKEVEGALDPTQAKELQDKLAAAEATAAKAVELETQLKEKEEALTKLSKKDFDYGRLREKTATEIEDMKKKMSEKEKLMLDEVMATRKELDDKQKAEFEETRKEVLKSLSGGDTDKQKSIEAAEKLLAGEAKTPRELEDRLRKAYILDQGVAPTRNPIFAGYSPSYREPNEKKERFTDTDAGKASLKAWFPKEAAKIYKEEKK